MSNNEMNDNFFKTNSIDTQNTQIVRKNKSNNTWTKLRILKKCQYCRNIKFHQRIIYHSLWTKYQNNNTLQSNIITRLIEKKSKQQAWIVTHDAEFNEEHENIKQYYNLGQLKSQISELVEYYKYYGQKPIMFMEGFFTIVFEYQQRKKMIQYNKLKVLLSLEPTEEENISQRKQRNQYQNFNILDEINATMNNSQLEDQSFTILQLKAKLQRYIVTSHKLTLQEIDRDFASASTASLRKGLCGDGRMKKIKYKKSNLSCNSKQTNKSVSNFGKKIKDVKKHKNREKVELNESEKTSKIKQDKSDIHKDRKNCNFKQKKSECKIKNQKEEIKATIASFKQKIRKEKRQLTKQFTKSNKSSDNLQRKYRGK